MTKITVLIVNYNSSEFVEASLFALKNLTKNEYKVLIIDNGSKLNDYKKLLKFASQYKNIFIERKLWKFDCSSMHHATALNHLVKKVNTPYFAILDADATFLIKNWDEILISKMDKNTPVGGTQAPDNKEKDFPLMFAILFRTKEFKELNIDFRPKNIEKHQDTGCELREKYLKKKYKCILLDFYNTRYYKNGPFKKILCAEYYLKNYKNIFASHFARGSSLGKNKYQRKKNVLNQIPIISNIYLYLKGQKEKYIWINNVKKIVKEQK